MAIDQATIGVRHGGAGDDGIGGAIDRHIDEIDLAHLVVNRPIRKSNPYLDAFEVGRSAGLSSLQEFALAHREGDIHRILADDRREDATVGADDITLGQSGAADLAGNRRDDVGVAKVDLRRLQVAFIGHDGALRHSFGRNGFVPCLFRGDVLCKQFVLPFPGLHRQLVLRFARLQRALGLVDRGIEQAFFDAIERRALLDHIALLEEDRLQVTLYSRPDLDAVDRLDPPDKVERLRDRPLFSADRADRDGSGRLRMR